MSTKSIKVIVAGLGRTGTRSLMHGLEILGYKPYHYMAKDDVSKWADYSLGKIKVDEVIDKIVDSGYNATLDQPCADIYKEQLARFPDAKVILTVRDNGEKWENSWKTLFNTVQYTEAPFSLTFPSFLQWIPMFRDAKVVRPMMGTHLGLERGELTHGWRNKEDGWLAKQYVKHNEQVTDFVPRDQLLVFNVKEGWAPLCKFLDKEIPLEPFPNVNDSASMRRFKYLVLFLTYAWVPFLILLALLGYNKLCGSTTKQKRHTE